MPPTISSSATESKASHKHWDSSILVILALFVSGMLFATAAMIEIVSEASTPTVVVAQFSLEALAAELPPVPTLMPPEPRIRLLHFGDAMFDRGVRVRIEAGEHPLDGLAEKLAPLGADFTIVNLEGPVTDAAECQDKPYSFKFDAGIPAALRAAGIDAVNLANNHSLDCYRAGYNDTRAALTGADVTPFGGFTLDESVTIEMIGSTKVALIGIDATIRAVPIREYVALIESLASSTDLQIVSIHWGIEYASTASEAQALLAHAFVEAGADAVFGHHPHVIEPVEVYKGAPIFYSLGNFIFDQTDAVTKRGLGASVEFDEHAAQAVTLYPIAIERDTPALLESSARDAACALLLMASSTSDPCSIEI